MPKGTLTTLFVSSTCYDLAQLRADIRDFSEAIGLDPIMSELDSFQVNPSKTTIQNCLDAVKNRADLFLLVVGGRYGSINEAGSSVTNLEYLEASAKGIPKYVFVKSQVLSLLPVWRANPTADFSSTVDTTKLFEFVANLRDNGDVWVFPFDTAQDITKTLKKQLSYLFSETLELRSKLQSVDLPILTLGPEALKIFIEKPVGWEFLAFAKILQDSIASHKAMKLDLELGISYEPVIVLNDRLAASNWVSKKFKQISQIISSLSRTLNGGIERAVGAPGEPGDIRRIEHLATRVADGYAKALEWTLEFHRLDVEPELSNLMKLAADFSSNLISDIETYSVELYGKIQEKIKSHSPGEVANFTLILSAPDSEEFLKELYRIKKL